MGKCDDGRKHVMVRGYRNKAGKTISRYERSCPAQKTNTNDVSYTCCVCGEEHKKDEIRTFTINEETKTICTGCADTIHGLL